MDRPVRKDIRLDNYDYSRNGAYFITICTKNKMCIFWDNNDKYKPIADNQPPIVGAASRRPQNNDKKIHLSEYGKIVKNELYKIPTIYSDIVFPASFNLFDKFLFSFINLFFSIFSSKLFISSFSILLFCKIFKLTLKDEFSFIKF